MSLRDSNYMVPAPASQSLLGFLQEMMSEGQAFLRSQRAYRDIDRAIEMMASEEDDKIPKTLSRVRLNPVKRNINEICATLSNLRPMWGFHTDNSDYLQHVENLNRLILAWWYNAFPDRGIRDSLKYSAVEGTGYASPVWERDFWCTGRGDIAIQSYGAREVVPYQISRDNDLQRAYAVTLVQEVPIVQA